MSKSKSSSSSTTDASQVTLSADGVVTGQVFNISEGGTGDQHFSYINEFDENVAKIFTQLIDVSAGAGQLAVDSSKNALAQVSSAYSQAAQPDLDFVKTQSKYLPILVGGAIIAIVLITRKK